MRVMPPVGTMMPAPVRRRSPVTVPGGRRGIVVVVAVVGRTPAVPPVARIGPHRIAVAGGELEVESVSVDCSREEESAVIGIGIAPAVHGRLHSAAETIAFFVPVALGTEMDSHFTAISGLEKSFLALDFLDFALDADPFDVVTGLGGIAFLIARLRDGRQCEGGNDQKKER